jgi:hypothetical protein
MSPKASPERWVVARGPGDVTESARVASDSAIVAANAGSFEYVVSPAMVGKARLTMSVGRCLLGTSNIHSKIGSVQMMQEVLL